QVTDASWRDGRGVHLTYDDEGRLTERSRSMNGRRREWVRYIYEDNQRLPVRIERPGVNPAAPHSTAFRYTAIGEIESVIERGFTPQPDGTFLAVERKRTFQYDEHGRVALVDGPRIDTPDLIRFEYDSQHR